MQTILKALFSSAAGALGGIWGYVAVAVFSAGLAATGAVISANKFALVKYQALELKDAKAVTSALEAQAAALQKIGAEQHILDLEVTAGAVAEATAQERIVTRTVTLTKEITRYVTLQADAVVCVPFGLVRVLDATILSGTTGNVSPAELALPLGQSDDACSPVKASDLAASIAANYGTAAQNAEQLNALQASVRNIIDKANAQ